MPTTIPANNPSRLHRFGFALAKLVKQPLKFATTDKLRWEIITKAINLISAPLTLQDLETLTASVNDNWDKHFIIQTAIEKNLIPKLTLEDLPKLTALVNADHHYQFDIIAQAIEKNLIPELTLQDLQTLTELVTKDCYRLAIITKAIEKNLIPKLTLADLQTLTASVKEDVYKLAIIKTATENNLISAPLTLEELTTLTALGTKNDYQDDKRYIIQTAIEKNLIPKLTLQDLPKLTELVNEDVHKHSIIQTAIEKNLIPKLTLEDLQTIAALVNEDVHKYSIIITAIEKNLIPKLTLEDLQTLPLEQLQTLTLEDLQTLPLEDLQTIAALVNEDVHKYSIIIAAIEKNLIHTITLQELKELTASVTEGVYRSIIIGKVIEKNLIPILTLQELKELTASVTEDSRKFSIFIAALNKGMQLTPENDLECFGLDKDDHTKRFEMINCFLEHKEVITCSALLQLFTLVSDEQKNTMIETVFSQKLILPSEIKFLKVAIFCQKLKNLALNPGQTTPAEENQEAAESAIRKYINNLCTNTQARDNWKPEENQENSFFTNRDKEKNYFFTIIEMQEIVKIQYSIDEKMEEMKEIKDSLYKNLLGIGQKEIDFFLNALKSGLNCAWEDNIELTREFVEKIREEEKNRQLLVEEEQNRQKPSAATPNSSPVAVVCGMLSQISNFLGLCQAG